MQASITPLLDIRPAATAATLNDSTLTVTELDAKQLTHVRFVLVTGDCAAAATLSAFKLRESNTSGSGFTDVPDQSFTVAASAAANDGKTFILEAPVNKRYYTATVTSAGSANFVVAHCLWVSDAPDVSVVTSRGTKVSA